MNTLGTSLWVTIPCYSLWLAWGQVLTIMAQGGLPPPPAAPPLPLRVLTFFTLMTKIQQSSKWQTGKILKSANVPVPNSNVILCLLCLLFTINCFKSIVLSFLSIKNCLYSFIQTNFIWKKVSTIAKLSLLIHFKQTVQVKLTSLHMEYENVILWPLLYSSHQCLLIPCP